MTIEEYIEEHIDAEGEYLHRLYRATQTKLLYGRMASGHTQGRLLKMLTEMIRPKNVLEIGTFSGYSALCMAEGLQEGAMLHTIEIFDELEEFTRPWLENSPWADKIKFYIGDALEVIPKLGIKFDMAFIDGNKRLYPEYYKLVKEYMNDGGYIIADNTLWDGHVLEEGASPQPSPKGKGDESERSERSVSHKDEQTVGVMRFNDMVRDDESVEKVIIPVRDGVTIIKVRS